MGITTNITGITTNRLRVQPQSSYGYTRTHLQNSKFSWCIWRMNTAGTSARNLFLLSRPRAPPPPPPSATSRCNSTFLSACAFVPTAAVPPPPPPSTTPPTVAALTPPSSAPPSLEASPAGAALLAIGVGGEVGDNTSDESEDGDDIGERGKLSSAAPG